MEDENISTGFNLKMSFLPGTLRHQSIVELFWEGTDYAYSKLYLF